MIKLFSCWLLCGVLSWIYHSFLWSCYFSSSPVIISIWIANFFFIHYNSSFIHSSIVFIKIESFRVNNHILLLLNSFHFPIGITVVSIFRRSSIISFYSLIGGSLDIIKWCLFCLFFCSCGLIVASWRNYIYSWFWLCLVRNTGSCICMRFVFWSFSWFKYFLLTRPFRCYHVMRNILPVFWCIMLLRPIFLSLWRRSNFILFSFLIAETLLFPFYFGYLWFVYWLGWITNIPWWLFCFLFYSFYYHLLILLIFLWILIFYYFCTFYYLYTPFL